MLGCSKINIEVSDYSIETVGFSDCREVSEYNEVTNGVLAIIHSRTWFFYKDKQKFIDSYTQSINRLYQVI